jgi:hypothetical protein
MAKSSNACDGHWFMRVAASKENLTFQVNCVTARVLIKMGLIHTEEMKNVLHIYVPRSLLTASAANL